MVVRLATTTDEPAIVSLCSAAFFEESLFGPVMHPYRHQYPEDVKIFWHEYIRNNFCEPRNRTVVSIVQENGEEKVVGMATWQRQGDDAGAKQVIRSWEIPGKRGAFKPLESTNNRASDPNKLAILHDAEPFFKHHWESTTNSVPRSSNYFLNVCAVHPDYQGRGIGASVVRWGLDRAREENVHASVLASWNTDAFYLKAGFDEVIADCKEGEGNPLAAAGVKGGNILFMWANKPGDVLVEGTTP